MKPQVIHPDPALEYAFVEEGCHILESWNHPDDAQASLARARVSPGNATRWHALRGVTERYLIVGGHGIVEVGERAPEAVQPGDVVVIPPGVRQRVRNAGGEDLVFYAVCTPRFTPDCYAALEED